MAGKYAEGTTVSPDRSQAEILATLRRYGAQGFAFGEEDNRAFVGFRFANRNVRFDLVLPASWTERQFAHDGAGRIRTDTAKKSAFEKEIARLWRCLALAIKAKLEVVESGIATFEEEFLAHIVLPSGKTVGSHVVPQLDNPTMPTSLLAIGPGGV
jgi:hypothetical protein